MFSALVEFLDDTSISYLKRQSTGLYIRISAEQEFNSYWKSRLAKTFPISVADVTGLNWKVIYKKYKMDNRLDQLIIQMFPADFVAMYIENIVNVGKQSSTLANIVRIYKTIFEFDRLDVLIRVRDIQDIELRFLGNFQIFLNYLVQCQNTWNILVYLIPDILKYRDLSKNVHRVVLNCLTSAAKCSNIENFILVDTLIRPANFRYFRSVLKTIISVGNYDLLKYSLIKYPDQTKLDLLKNLNKYIVHADVVQPMSLFIITQMSKLEYLRFLEYMVQYFRISDDLWIAVILDLRTPKEFIRTRIKPRLYEQLWIYNSILLKYTSIMNLNSSRFLNTSRFGGDRRIPIDVLVYLLTSKRVPESLREYLNELIKICNVPVHLDNKPQKRFSTDEAMKLINYLLDVKKPYN